MVKCLKSLKAMFEEEGKKNSELNAKSSFVITQVVIGFLIMIYIRLFIILKYLIWCQGS